MNLNMSNLSSNSLFSSTTSTDSLFSSSNYSSYDALPSSLNNKDSSNTKAGGVTSHYYWRCGVWTTSKNDNCYVVKDSKTNQFSGLFSNPSMMPIMRVIQPNTMSNINVLSYYDDLSESRGSGVSSFNSQRRRRRRRNNNYKKVGVFKDYIFFSKKCTYGLERMIDLKSSLIDVSRLYQFESRHFQYSVLQGKITFIESENGDEFMIFRFAHSSKYADKSALYGIASPNCRMDPSHPNYQPWVCVDIVTESNILSYFNLANSSEQGKLDFLSYLPTPIECHEKKFNSKLGFDCDFSGIGKLLCKGGYTYGKEKFDRSGNGSGRSNGSSLPCISNTLSNGSSFNDTGSVCSDNSSICSIRSSLSFSSFSSNMSNGSNKIKNEDKFDYLNTISRSIGISFGELIERILDSIEDAFAFAQQFPDTVLTQAYIDEDKCTIFYEPVLIAEIEDRRDENNYCKTYKFGVPIVEDKKGKYTNDGKKCYVARNILTPQMAIENILLNTPNHVCNDKDSWLMSIQDTESFCDDYGMDTVYDPKQQQSLNMPHSLKKQMSSPFVTPPRLPFNVNSRRSVEIV